MRFKIVGFTGAAGAGKDTAASGLIDAGWQKVSFADPIKEALNAMMGWNMSDWADREWKESEHYLVGRSPRYMAQTLGTEWGRDTIHPDIWIALGLERCHGKATVIPDVRFDNEAKAIHDAGGQLIEIVRPDNPFAITGGHASESGVDRQFITHTIVNDGDVGKMISAVDSIVFL